MTTKLFGTKVERTEDERFLRGKGRYVDDVGAGALHAAVLRSPHAHARILAIDVDAVLDVEGVHAVWTYDDLTGAMADPLPLLIPHPALTHGRTQYALAKDEVNYVGEAIAFVVADDRYIAEDALVRDPGRLRVPHPGGRHRHRPGRDEPRPRRRARQHRRPDGAGERRRPRGHRRRPAHADPRPDRRAQRLHADGGPRHRRPLGPRLRAPPGVDLHPDLDRRPRRGGRQARPRPRPGRRDHPRRRRWLRRQDQPPLARGAAGPAGRADPRPAGEVHRGPPRALHLQRPRARAGAAHRGRLRRRGPAARARRDVLARPRRLHAVRPHRPDHHLHPAARALQAGELPGGLRDASTRTP